MKEGYKASAAFSLILLLTSTLFLSALNDRSVRVASRTQRVENRVKAIGRVNYSLRSAQSEVRGYLLTEKNHHIVLYKKFIEDADKINFQEEFLPEDQKEEVYEIKNITQEIEERLKRTITKKGRYLSKGLISLLEENNRFLDRLMEVSDKLQNEQEVRLSESIETGKDLQHTYTIYVLVSSVLEASILLMLFLPLRRFYRESQKEVVRLGKENEEKDEYMSTVSHELRAPMTNITMAVQMIKITLGKDGFLDRENNGDLRQYVKILQTESNREVDLINDLLDIGRVESNVPIGDLDSIPLAVHIPHLLEAFEIRCRTRLIQFTISIPEGIPEYQTELSSFDRILTEILHNALKYTPDGEAITVSVLGNPDGIEISVQNTGVSLPTEDLEKIFDKFYRIPLTDLRKSGGTGLGLTLVRKLVHRLGGSICALSDPNSTTFRISLPYTIKKW